MTKDVEHDGDAADFSSDSVVGGGDVSVGKDSGLEAPKRPRSAAQIAAFEKARAKRAENLSKLSENVEKATKKITPFAPPTPPEVVVTPKRKPRADKGKRRGRIVKYEEEENQVQEEEEVSSTPPPYFVIV
jgi:hypothetical protein